MLQTFMNHVNMLTETLRWFHFDQIPPQVAIWHQLHDNHHLHKQYHTTYTAVTILGSHMHPSLTGSPRVTTPRREMTLGWENCPMMAASLRNVTRLSSWAPGWSTSLTTGTHPHSLVHCAKLACSKMFLCSAKNFIRLCLWLRYVHSTCMNIISRPL